MRASQLIAGLIVFAPLFGCGSDESDAAGNSGGSAAVAGGAGASAGGTAGAAFGGAGGGGAGSGGTGALAGSAGASGSVSAPSFDPPLTLSEPANSAFVPALAAREGTCLIAWHEFVGGQTRIAYVVVDAGTPGSVAIISDPLGGPKRPSVAATPTGWVVAYQANDGTSDVVRSVEIDASGAIVAGPETISAPGEPAAMARVASSGEQRAYAWTSGSAHWFALRGPQTLAASAVGTTLQSQVILNFPRIALAGDGTLFLAFRDGGTDGIDWDVLLTLRPTGGTFGAPVDISNSPALLSDDISLALEPDGTLDIAWVDQDPNNVNAFEVSYATRSPAGSLSAPARYGNQGLWAWEPSVVPGLAAVWRVGAAAIGPMYFGAPSLPPTPILAGEQAASQALAQGPDGAYHLVWATGGSERQIRYSRGH